MKPDLYNRAAKLIAAPPSRIDPNEATDVLRGIQICADLAYATVCKDAAWSSLEGCDAEEFDEVTKLYDAACTDEENGIEAYRRHFLGG